MNDKNLKTDSKWKEVLTPEEYRITREKGTEKPFTGKYYKTTKSGKYKCVCCNEPLFSSETKYDSGSGWPSFYKPIDNENVEYEEDYSDNRHRIEVKCRKCGAHLGHVFEDGPQPTGRRFCINSVALHLDEKEK